MEVHLTVVLVWLLALAWSPAHAGSFGTYDLTAQTLYIHGLAADLNNDGAAELYSVEMFLNTNGTWQLTSVAPYQDFQPPASTFDLATGVVSVSRLYLDTNGDTYYETLYAVELQLYADNTYSLLSVAPTDPASLPGAGGDPSSEGSADCATFGLALVETWAKVSGAARIRITHDAGLVYLPTYKQWFQYDWYLQYASVHLGTWGRAEFMHSTHPDGVVWLDGDALGDDGITHGGGIKVWVANASIPAVDAVCEMWVPAR